MQPEQQEVLHGWGRLESLEYFRGWEKFLPKCVLGFNPGDAGNWMF